MRSHPRKVKYAIAKASLPAAARGIVLRDVLTLPCCQTVLRTVWTLPPYRIETVYMTRLHKQANSVCRLQVLVLTLQTVLITRTDNASERNSNLARHLAFNNHKLTE